MELIALDAAQATARRLGGAVTAVGSRLQAAGFNEAMVCAWFEVPLVSDARFRPAPPSKSRRGLGGLIACLCAGEALPAEALRPLGAADLAVLEEIGLLARASGELRAQCSIVPFRGALVISDRFGERDPRATPSPDVSAWNLSACLPRGARTVLDIGTGAGAVALAAARLGATVLGADVDARALGFARLGALLNGVEPRFVESDLFAGLPRDVIGRFDVVAFNAPLARAELAGDGAPLYLRSPRGEALGREFLEGARARVAEGGEALLHTQLTDAVEAAAEGAGFARRPALHFADAPDGTPHALLSLQHGAPAGASRARVPLGPACPHLKRELCDRLHATRDVVADRYLRPAGFRAAVLRPAPWLELCRTAIHDGLSFKPREVRFGAIRVTDEELRLIEGCDGRPAEAVADTGPAFERLALLAERGLLVV